MKVQEKKRDVSRAFELGTRSKVRICPKSGGGLNYGTILLHYRTTGGILRPFPMLLSCDVVVLFPATDSVVRHAVQAEEFPPLYGVMAVSSSLKRTGPCP